MYKERYLLPASEHKQTFYLHKQFDTYTKLFYCFQATLLYMYFKCEYKGFMNVTELIK